MLQGFNEDLNAQKADEIAKLGGNLTPDNLERILSRRIRSEKVA